MFIFEVGGAPKPQKQTEFACNCPPTRKCKKWGYNPSSKEIEMVQWQVKPFAPAIPLKGAIELSMTFYLPIPKNTSAAKRRQMLNQVILPTIAPDEDNCSYLITNALKKLVYEDDKQIFAKHVYKFYGDNPKTVIKVREILQMEPVGLDETDI